MRLLFHPFGVAIWQDMSILTTNYRFIVRRFGNLNLFFYLCTRKQEADSAP